MGSAIEALAYQIPVQQRFATRAVCRPPVPPRGNSFYVHQSDYNRRHGQKSLLSSAASDAVAFPTPSGEGVSSTSSTSNSNVGLRQLNKVQSALTKAGLLLFIMGMCMALPVALLPPFLAEKFGFIDRLQREQYALRSGCFCSRWLMRLIPFANISVYPHLEDDPEPSVWVANHTSMLDIFVLLATDKKLRGKNRRPIKIVYWKQLEENKITKLLFTQCGMIPVDMADNGNGNANEYDKGSFKRLLKDMKAAFADGFDIGEWKTVIVWRRKVLAIYLHVWSYLLIHFAFAPICVFVQGSCLRVNSIPTPKTVFYPSLVAPLRWPE